MQNIFKSSFFLGLLLLVGCGESINSQLTGTMVGYVVAIDSIGSSHDNSGVKISIDGTDYSTVSDNKGRWELHNVIPGTYNISLAKEKYAMEKMIAYKFVGNGTDYLDTSKIYQMMWTRTVLVIRPFDSGIATFSCRLSRQDSTQSLNGAVMLLFGKEKCCLSPENPDSYSYELDNYYQVVRGGIAADRFIGYSFLIDTSNLIKSGFHSKDTIYCEAFGSNLVVIQHYDILADEFTFGPSYFDIETAKSIYTGFGNNHSEVKSFILP
jgi:hypothetical protein